MRTLICIVAGIFAIELQAQEQSDFIHYQQDRILLENARVVDVVNEKVLSSHSIYIEEGRIAKVDKTGNIVVPDTILRVDLTGKTVLPGLVMLHEHLSYFSGRAIWDFHPVSFPKLFLAAGVTTIRTAGAENPTYDLNLKRRIDSGNAIGPGIHVTGPFFNSIDGDFLGDTVLSGYEEAREVTAYWAKRGCTSFKVYSDIGREALRGIVDEAHSRGLMVTGHLGRMSCSEAAELGIDNIEHGFGSCLNDLGLSLEGDWQIDPDDPKVAALIDKLIEKNVVLTITPISDSNFGAEESLVYLSEDERRRIDEYAKNPPPWRPNETRENQFRFLEKLFVQKGGKLVLGADAADFGVIPGFQNHNVLESMVKGRWKPMEILKMATIDGAVFLNIDEEVGSIAEGKIADLLIVSGKPDKSIQDIRNVELVFRNGVGYNPTALRESAKGLVGRH